MNVIIIIVLGLFVLGFIIFRFGAPQKTELKGGTTYVHDNQNDKYKNQIDSRLDNFEKTGGRLIRTRMDEILILRSGIYVVKRVDGDSDAEDAVIQNQRHIKYISAVLKGGHTIPVHNIVVYPNECSLRDITNETDAYIVKEGILIETILKTDNLVGTALSSEQIENTYNILKEASKGF